MRAIILAAGKGERLKSVEPDVPKPMVRIADTPVLEFTIEHLNSCGIHDIVITTGWLSNQIIDYFDDPGIRYTVEVEPLGTAGGFKQAMREYPTDEAVLVWNGDNFSTCDPQRMLEYHESHGRDATIAVCWRKDTSRSGHVTWDDFNRIEQFQEKWTGLSFYGWVSAGIYILEPQMLNIIPDIGDFGKHVFPAAIRLNMDLYAYGFSQDEWLRWYDTPEDLAQLRKDYP